MSRQAAGGFSVGVVQTRDLSEREAEVLALLLEPEFPGVEALRRQAATARVTGRCPCGCATIYLATDPAAAAAEGVPDSPPSAVFAHGRPRGDDRPGPGLHLDVLDGRLSAIEIVSFDEMVEASVFGVFPAPEEFEAPEVPQVNRRSWRRLIDPLLRRRG